MPFRLLAFFLLTLAVPVATCASPPKSSVQEYASVLEIPFRLPLDGLLREAEQLVPTQTGYWHDWKKWHGVDTQYRAWRGRLGMEFRGDTLTMQAHVRYWVRARKNLLGSLGLSGSCGADEPPRQAIIGVQVRLVWNPDWTLRPLLRILPTRFLDRCEMTAAGIDVTPLVEQVFRQRMKQSLHDAIRVLAPAMRQIRSHAERAWRGLQRPVQLTGDGWLSLNPLGMSLSPPSGRREQAVVHLGVLLRPEVTIGDAPAVKITPLPPLVPFLSATRGLRFQINLALDYELLSHHLSEALKDRQLTFKDKQLSILSARVSGKEQELSVKLELGADAAGSAEIWADVSFDPEVQSLQLRELNFIYDPVDTDAYLMANLFHERIRQTLQETANAWLDSSLDQLNDRLGKTLVRIAPEDTRLDPGSLSFSQVDIVLRADGVDLRGMAHGDVGIRFE